nr:hypothetical protein [Micromonospora sp. DSM 115978]
MTVAKCGTYAGYKRHQNHREPACQPCKDAVAARAREARRDPDSADGRSRRHWSTATNRALARLREECRERYDQILAEELHRVRDGAR